MSGLIRDYPGGSAQLHRLILDRDEDHDGDDQMNLYGQTNLKSAFTYKLITGSFETIEYEMKFPHEMNLQMTCVCQCV